MMSTAILQLKFIEITVPLVQQFTWIKEAALLASDLDWTR